MKEHIEVDYKGLKLRGYHQKVNETSVVIITHGIGGNKLGHKYVFRQMADACEKEGISSIRIDFAGSGESDGNFEELTHSDQVDQLHNIITEAIVKLGYEKIYLCSTTIGCYSIWQNANKFDEVKAVINWNPITNFDRYYNNAKGHAIEDGSIDYNGLHSNPSYLSDLSRLERTIPTLSVPVLILQGENDKEYAFEDARELCQERDWKYLKVRNGDHLWNGKEVRGYLFGNTIDFIKQN